MDPVFLLLLLGGSGLLMANGHQQRQRIALLAHHLGPLQIEKLMETLTQGYLRALGESDPERQAQIFALLPRASFDMRKLLAVHANGIARALKTDAARSPRDRAFLISAELFLMQHSCHWFCKSRAVASARMVARHHTPHAQLVASVSPETRSAYRALTGS